jgi:hypothetical protein
MKEYKNKETNTDFSRRKTDLPAVAKFICAHCGYKTNWLRLFNEHMCKEYLDIGDHNE